MLLEAIQLDEFLIRPLSHNEDLRTYLKWMRDPERYPFIKSTRTNYSESELVAYIKRVNSSVSAIQYGIFSKPSMEHIGNIKFHDINFEEKSCFVGFLIADQRYQNRGLAGLVFNHCAKQLMEKFQIVRFYLSVERQHLQAIRAYTKIGFKPENQERGSTSDSTFTLVLQL